jgi:hypothetical protein
MTNVMHSSVEEAYGLVATLPLAHFVDCCHPIADTVIQLLSHAV